MNLDIQAGKFMQILHTGQGHQNTVLTFGTNHPEYILIVRFISIPTMGNLKAQNAALLATKEKAVIVKFMDVQMQCGEVTAAYLPFLLPQRLENSLDTSCLTRKR